MPTSSIPWPKYSTNVRVNGFRIRFLSMILNGLDRVAPAVAAAVVQYLFFQPRSSPIPTDRQSLLAEGRSFELMVNGRRVAAWRWGSGPAVLLVHGWGSRGIRMGGFIRPLLERGRSVITYDAPGHGQSEGRTSSYFEMIDAVSAFLDPAANFGITGVIGHSIGAGAVVRAVAGHSAGQPAVALVAPSLRLHRLLQHTFDGYGVPRRLINRLIDQFEQRYGYRFSADDPWRHMNHLTGLVAVVHDREDRVVAFSDTQDVVRTLPGVMLDATTGLGHRHILADARVISRIVDRICSVPAIFGAA